MAVSKARSLRLLVALISSDAPRATPSDLTAARRVCDASAQRVNRLCLWQTTLQLLREVTSVSGLIIHEWIAKAGGSENVLDQFTKAFPDADIQALWNDAPHRFPASRVKESWLSGTPLRRNKAAALPLLPMTWRRLGAARQYDWMLVSSHLFAHHARLRGSEDVPKLVYAHTPARYIWEPDLDTRGANMLVRAVAGRFRSVDRRRAQEARAIATNSEFTRRRINRVWGRDAIVVYPPVDVARIRAVTDWSTVLDDEDSRLLESLPEDYLLGASRFVPYKRLETVIDAGVATGRPVVIAGDGPAEADLRAHANRVSARVHFVASPSDSLLYAMYQRAAVYVFPAVEDFGIMPVEAMACGTPAIVAPIGGAVESVSLATGGSALQDLSVSSWQTALDQALDVDRRGLPERVERFSAARFRAEIIDWVAASV